MEVERGRGVAKLCVCGCGGACVWMQRRRKDRVRKSEICNALLIRLWIVAMFHV